MIKKLLKIFSSMPKREKVVVCILAAIFLFSFFKFIISNLHFSISQEKGVFAEGIVGHVKDINPLFVEFNDTDRDICELVFSGLIKYDPLKRNFLPDLASTWSKSRNGLTYTFTLRDNLRWHDDQPLTMDDVLFTFKDVLQNPTLRNPILKSAFEGVAVAKTDDKTILFTLPKPNSYFISNLTVGILPKHILGEATIATLEKNSFGQNPIGSGPYKVDSIKLDSSGDAVSLVAFENYYDEKPKIEKLRIFTFPNEDTLLKQRDALNAISKLGPEREKIVENDPAFASYNYILNQFTALYLNTDNQFLKDKKFRQALALTLNKGDLVLSSERRVDSLDLQDHSKDSRFAYNQEAAAKMLDKMGYTTGTSSQYRVNNKGETVSLLLLVPSKIPTEISEKIKSQWGKIGVKLDIKTADSTEFYTLVNERRYGVLLIKQNLGYNRDVYPIFHSSQIAGASGNPSGLNFSNSRSFQTDGLTEAIRKENYQKDKEKLLNELSKVIAEEVPVIFISTPVYSYNLRKNVEKFPADSLDFHSDRLSILPYLQPKNN